jgi:hypothetical protein
MIVGVLIVGAVMGLVCGLVVLAALVWCVAKAWTEEFR